MARHLSQVLHRQVDAASSWSDDQDHGGKRRKRGCHVPDVDEEQLLDLGDQDEVVDAYTRSFGCCVARRCRQGGRHDGSKGVDGYLSKYPG